MSEETPTAKAATKAPTPRTFEDSARIAAEEALTDAGATELETDILATEVAESLLMDYDESLNSAAKRHLKDYRKGLAA